MDDKKTSGKRNSIWIQKITTKKELTDTNAKRNKKKKHKMTTHESKSTKKGLKK